MRKEKIVKGFELSYRYALDLHDSIYADHETAKHRLSCKNCPRLELEWDNARGDYHPYCWEYDVWNETVPFWRSVRNGVCLKHGRPKLSEVYPPSAAPEATRV
jgi:hypothetical protein